jgi:hypothetical protein
MAVMQAAALQHLVKGVHVEGPWLMGMGWGSIGFGVGVPIGFGIWSFDGVHLLRSQNRASKQELGRRSKAFDSARSGWG